MLLNRGKIFSDDKCSRHTLFKTTKYYASRTRTTSTTLRSEPTSLPTHGAVPSAKRK